MMNKKMTISAIPATDPMMDPTKVLVVGGLLDLSSPGTLSEPVPVALWVDLTVFVVATEWAGVLVLVTSTYAVSVSTVSSEFVTVCFRVVLVTNVFLIALADL